MSTAAGLAEQKTWEPQPAAERVVQGALTSVCDALPIAANLRDRLLAEAGVRMGDLIDTIYVAANAPLLAAAHAVGWERAERAGQWQLWRNAKGVFPQIASSAAIATGYVGLDLKVESVAHFLFVHGLPSDIAGDVDDCFRRACVARNDHAELAVTERLGWAGLLEGAPSVDASLRQRIYESFLLRPRQAEDEATIFDAANDLVDRAIDATNRDVACALFFAAERAFWMQRNRAGVLQFSRQQRLGIGWANHDHHTYRSSRQYFSKLVALWEKLGLVCRERFYAGREAGWGAQVMEQPITGIVTFNDVDLSPDELFGDFSHDGLGDEKGKRDRLGTIGLWCGLHGESLTSAGMHHLEAMFGFDALRDQLTDAGVGVMKPFTDFGYLRQAFTEGERWAVAASRIERLLTLGLITAEQAETFRAKGALGSHLENLERNAGFKGFNQTGVSEIIAATDPRKR